MSRDREPRPPHRLLRLWAWMVGAFLAFLVLAMGATAFYVHDSSDTEGCHEYHFSSDKWLSWDDTDNQAGMMVRCKTLDGMSRAALLEKLGSAFLIDDPTSTTKSWTFRAGEVDSYSGTEKQRLYVNFNKNDNVSDTHLAYPEVD